MHDIVYCCNCFSTHIIKCGVYKAEKSKIEIWDGSRNCEERAAAVEC